MTLSPTLLRAPEVEAVKEPAKQWRTQWVTLHAWLNADDKHLYLPGETIWSKSAWPSKEIALEMAAKNFLDPANAAWAGKIEIVDAFPIEAAP